MGGLSAVIGAYNVMNPAVPSVDAEPVQLEGGDFYAMWDSFCTQMRAVSSNLETAETAVADGCRAVLTDFTHNPETYSLTRNTRHGSQYDDFDGLQIDELHVIVPHLKEMSGAAELVGDQQTGLSGFLVGVDALGNPASTVGDEWVRGSLPDGTSIGMGGDGPYGTYQQLIAALADLLRDEGANSHRMAEALMRTALDFDQTDRLSRDELRLFNREVDRQADRLDHNPLVRGNDPDDPWYAENAQ